MAALPLYWVVGATDFRWKLLSSRILRSKGYVVTLIAIAVAAPTVGLIVSAIYEASSLPLVIRGAVSVALGAVTFLLVRRALLGLPSVSEWEKWTLWRWPFTAGALLSGGTMLAGVGIFCAEAIVLSWLERAPMTASGIDSLLEHRIPFVRAALVRYADLHPSVESTRILSRGAQDLNNYVAMKSLSILTNSELPSAPSILAQCMTRLPGSETCARALAHRNDIASTNQIVNALPFATLRVRYAAIDSLLERNAQVAVSILDSNSLYERATMEWIKRMDATSLRTYPFLTMDILERAIAKSDEFQQRQFVYAAIGIGPPDMISSFERILRKTGSVTVAEQYLNCGNSDLADIAKNWAKDNGYKIVAGKTPQLNTWGKW